MKKGELKNQPNEMNGFESNMQKKSLPVGWAMVRTSTYSSVGPTLRNREDTHVVQRWAGQIWVTKAVNHPLQHRTTR